MHLYLLKDFDLLTYFEFTVYIGLEILDKCLEVSKLINTDRRPRVPTVTPVIYLKQEEREDGPMIFFI